MVSGISGNGNQWLQSLSAVGAEPAASAAVAASKTAVIKDQIEQDVPHAVKDTSNKSLIIPSSSGAKMAKPVAAANELAVEIMAESVSQPLSLSEFNSWLKEQPLSNVQKKAAQTAYKAAAGAADKAALLEILKSPSFASMPVNVQDGLLVQATLYPESEALKNMTGLTAMAWFTDLDSGDQLRALGTVGLLSCKTWDGTIDESSSYRFYTLNKIMAGESVLLFNDSSTTPVDLSLDPRGVAVSRQLFASTGKMEPLGAEQQKVLLDNLPKAAFLADILKLDQESYQVGHQKEAAVRDLVNSDLFSTMPRAEQKELLNVIINGAPEVYSSSQMLLTNENFKKLPLDKQSAIMKTIATNESGILQNLAWSALLDNPAFKAADNDMQQALLNVALKNGGQVSELQSLTKVWSQAASLNVGQQNYLIKTLAATKDIPASLEAFAVLLDNESFVSADDQNKMAILAQGANFPTPAAIKNLNSLLAVTWFKEMDLADRQRAAKSVAYLSETAASSTMAEQKAIVNNTLERLLNGSIPLNFVEMDDDPGVITYGYAYPNRAGIYINRALIPAGNEPFPQSDRRARHAILSTIPHEVNHQVNNDANLATYKYYQGEYRAWYVGWIAEYGRKPTCREAFDRSKDLFGIYSNIKKALYEDKTESAQIVAFLNQIIGAEIKAETSGEIDELLKKALKDPMAEAPAPDPGLNPDNDN